VNTFSERERTEGDVSFSLSLFSLSFSLWTMGRVSFFLMRCGALLFLNVALMLLLLLLLRVVLLLQ